MTDLFVAVVGGALLAAGVVGYTAAIACAYIAALLDGEGT